MPIKLPATLPAYKTLAAEGVMVMDEDQAARQDIRPLRIALLNLMPKKIETEIQFTRLIGATPAADRSEPDPNERASDPQHIRRAYG